MKIFLIRHAHAGHRSPGGRDIYRQLSPRGQERADELARALADQGAVRILSSPATRCVQTVAPLAELAGVVVEECQPLWEGSGIDEALDLLAIEGPGCVVACSHGDIIPGVIELLAGMNVPVQGRGCELGSIWILEFDGGRWTGARYGGVGTDWQETPA